MISILEKLGFKRDTHNIWRPSTIPSFEYSDGEVEIYLLDSLKKAQDVSVTSQELKELILDWPSRYHLSRRRTNLLRPFKEWFQGKTVLEIGCGCGAITRFLGEIGANVVAFEGSLRRAQIARERCRDLDNVHIVWGTHNHLGGLPSFDAVLLIGVLEYARKYAGPHGHHILLQQARQYLKQEGVLFLAIENQLGLKYFAGAPEDHLGQPMIGINDNYDLEGIATYGGFTLENLLKGAGFSAIERYLPLPDYKLPVALVTPLGWKNFSPELANLATEVVRADPQPFPHHLFSLEKSTHLIWKNRLAHELSNSFLLTASPSVNHPPIAPQELCAYFYTDERYPYYNKETCFYWNDQEKCLSVSAKLLDNSSSPPQNDAVLIHHVDHNTPFYNGNTLWYEIVSALNRPNWKIEDLVSIFQDWLYALLDYYNLPRSYTATTLLPGSAWDMLPHNAIRRDCSTIEFIDREWELKAPVELGYVAFRAHFHSLLRLLSVEQPHPIYGNLSMLNIYSIFSKLGLHIDEELFKYYIAQENTYANHTHGYMPYNYHSILDSLTPRAQSYPPNSYKDLELTPALYKDYSAYAKYFMEKSSSLEEKVAYLQGHIESLISSRSWKITRPYRWMGKKILEFLWRRNFYKNILLPQLLRRRIKNFIYPFFFSTMQVGLNDPEPNSEEGSSLVKLDKVSRYVPLLTKEPLEGSPIRLIALYLPQFHAIPENDQWWGKGFTEWTNVIPAQPQFKGHYQPHIPGELGYYNLLDTTVQRRQIELAKLYGLGGFCFYFYWFGGKRLLEQPVLNYLNDPSLDFPFCLCWANENWTRRWDGLDHEILMQQNYSPEDDLKFIEYVAQYLNDPRYICIQDKPLLIIYNIDRLPEASETATRWRTFFRERYGKELYLACTWSFGNVNPNNYGFDAAMEFPPNNSHVPDITHLVTNLNEDFKGHIYDWRPLVERSENYPKPKHQLFRGVCPSWDNTARRKNKGTIFLNSSPQDYQRWLYNATLETTQRIQEPTERLVFVNAWNEWAEGAHLEPDERYGYAFLEASRLALHRAKIQHAVKKYKNSNLAIIIHAYYLDLFQEIMGYINRLRYVDITLYVTTIPENESNIKKILETCRFPGHCFVYENKGRDILPFLKVLPTVISNQHQFFIKVHTKKSPHRLDGDQWRHYLLDKLLLWDNLKNSLNLLEKNPTLGLLCPKNYLVPISYYWGSNAIRSTHLALRLGINLQELSNLQFIAGSMFMGRVSALEILTSLAIGEEDFEEEAGQIDGTMAHAMERIFSLAAQVSGFETLETP